ncbi:putative membrane protein-like protein [Emericellopsis cladophorae]|uniref:Membrane protein-like protein n=1 Tax=Emericellopsis cladophorae TaxID=2686198 RepID=A0A9Q0BEM9_9HYPO|nr:putative membrane protein-like protein [Emericellopsis cladophorae]KAI6781775.1 putative membrane protein-like protein [Emericellopsis cladophorae]
MSSDAMADKRGRIIASVAATAIALACGSNYVYSAWAPQFAERLGLSATESNLIGLFGNLGMYTMGVPIGMFIDNGGPRPAVLAGSVLLAVGYFPLHRAYDSASGPVPLLCFFSYLSGLGGCMAFAAAVKTSALNWPQDRGTATAFPLAAFGLSAFFFSLLGGILFPGDPSDFLLLLGVGTCGLTLVGFFFLKVYPHQRSSYHALQSGDGEEDDAEDLVPDRPARLWRTSSKELKARRANGNDMEPDTIASPDTPTSVGDAAAYRREDPDETTPLFPSPCDSSEDLVADSIIDLDRSHRVDIRGLKLLANVEFWQLFLIMAILAGVGLMTINNIGNNAKALWKKHDDSVSSEFLVSRQQMHVSILSVCSFLGRLSSGVGSDFLVKRLHASRVWCLVLATVIFFCAQVCALNIENPHLLGFVSSLSGLGYGFLFGVFPSIVAETFGIRGLSQNWGFITLAPVVSSNVFNIFYGQTYDAHTVKRPSGEMMCMDGLECYKSAYWMTFCSCVVGLGASLWTIRHQHVRHNKELSKGDEED